MDIGICLNDANIFFFCSPEGKELTILYVRV